MACFAASDTLTSITPASFVDDGVRFECRTPSRSPWDINKWLQGTSGQQALSTIDSSTYTGSYVDDGADMLPSRQKATIPGFGTIDKKFYRKGKRAKDDGPWTDKMARAIGGDVQRSLAKLKRYDNVCVVDPDQEVREKKEEARTESGRRRVGEVDEDGGVWMKLPPTWGDFIIECPNGRVIVVDKDGTYDSGLPGEHMVDWSPSRKEKEGRKWKAKEQERQKRRDDRSKREEAAAKAATKSRIRRRRESRAKRDNEPLPHEQHRKHWSSHRKRSSSSAAKPLAPILEAHGSEFSADFPSHVPSFTDLFMTGHKSEWTSRTLSPTKGWTSPSPSLPGAWPSPARSTVKPASEANWGTVPVVNSQVTVRPDIWERDELWQSPVSGTKLGSKVPPRKSRRSTSYLFAHGARTEQRQGEDSKAHISPLEPFRLPMKSVTFEPGWYKPNVEDYYSYIPPETTIYHGSSPTRSNGPWDMPSSAEYTSTTTSDTAPARVPFEQDWNASIATRSRSSTQTSRAMSAARTPHNETTTTDEDIVTEHHAASDEDSLVSTVRPYSWRRDEEDESTYSTAGSIESGSGVISDADPGMWQKDDTETDLWVDDGDARSAKSDKSTTSTYRHPTVEDVPETPEKEPQEWVAAAHTSEWTSTAAEDFGAGAAESAAGEMTAEDGDQHGSTGGWNSMKDNGGYDEDNETWLNREVGGVKYREAEWRRSGAISWKDV